MSRLVHRQGNVNPGAIALLVLVTGTLVNVAPAAAQSQPSACPAPGDRSIQARLTRLFNRNCSTRGESQASGRANGGAVRDELCSAEAKDQALVALVPQTNQGTTISAQPSFFFYVPYSSSETGDLVAEFMVLNEDLSYRLDQPLRVTLPDQPGIVRVDLAATPASLNVGDRYNWYFSILCEDWELSRNPFVSGWVERVDPTTTDEAWYDLLMALTDDQGGDRPAWASLLSLFDLEAFADKPVEPLSPVSQ
jgi:hypothetical protein